MSTIVCDEPLASEVLEVATSFHSRELALRCWRDVVDTCGMDDKVIADAAGMTPSYFSKVSSGQQGDLLGMVFIVGRTYPAMRAAFILGLAELEGADPVTHAAEQLVHAALRFVRIQSEAIALKMARADSREKKRGAA